jgi:hypothetical protein
MRILRQDWQLTSAHETDSDGGVVELLGESSDFHRITSLSGFVECECWMGCRKGLQIADVQKKPKVLANRLISPARPNSFSGNIEALE